MTTYYGSARNDHVHSGNWNYSWHEMYLGDGLDYVTMPENAQSLVLYAGNGDDFIVGSSNNDVLYGENGNDVLYGMKGSDWLIGGNGNDILLGGEGRDYLLGGSQADQLYGGAGSDYFYFFSGDSIPHASYADTIQDWDVREDYIITNLAGTSSNYGEYQTGSSDIGVILGQITNSSWRYSKDHVFAYNAGTDTGYLFSDLNGDNYFESAVVMVGAGSANDLNWSDIL